MGGGGELRQYETTEHASGVAKSVDEVRDLLRPTNAQEQ